MKRSSFLIVLLVCWAIASLAGASRAESNWKTGKQFRQQLNLETGVTWSENPLRKGLRNLSRNQGVAVFLDRRIDPDQPVDLTQSDVSLESLFRHIAARVRAGVCLVGPVVYVGPETITQRLATVVALRQEEAQKLPAGTKQRLLATQPWTWEELSTPRDLLQQLANESGLKLTGLEQVPHDLWPAGDLPPMSLVERLSLVLAGFDLTFTPENNGTVLKLMPLPENVRLVKSYPLKGNATQLVSRIQQALPKAQFKQATGQLHVAGSAEDHDTVARLLAGEPVKPDRAVKGVEVFTLKIDNQPVGAITRALAEKLQLEASFDPRISNAKLNQLVSFDVKQVSRDQLLDKLLSPAGLTFRVQGGKLEVSPAP